MATNDVPGANPANKDKLSRGCWGEHEDGSIIFVKDIDENDRVIMEMYDFQDTSAPVYYSHAMSLKDFEQAFSYDPKKTETQNLKWTWHDKTPMPWAKVMKLIERPVPTLANVADQLSAAEQMARSLQIRVADALTRDHVNEEQGLKEAPVNASKSMWDRIKNAIGVLGDD